MIYVEYKYGDSELKVDCYRALVNALTTFSERETPAEWSDPSNPKAGSLSGPLHFGALHPVGGFSSEVAEDNRFSMGIWNADISP